MFLSLWSLRSLLDKSTGIKYNLIIPMKQMLILEIFGILFFLSAAGLSAPDTFAAGDNPCLDCHTELKKTATSIHAALASGCQACHMTVEGKKHPEQKNSMELIQNAPQLCYGCHDSSQFKGKSVHPPVVVDTCTACHNPHQSNFKVLLIKDIPGLCYECHKESKFKGKSVHQPVGGGLCMSCHKPHASNFSKMLINEPPELCYRCHDKKVFTKKYVHVVAAIPNGCNLCHNPHTGDHQNLLLQPVFDLCTSCHSAEANGRHVLAVMFLGEGERVHPVRGVPDPSKPSRELLCISCHNPHSSEYSKLFVQRNLCARCHKSY
jgi:predicted CXXCH cytochrome family protein